MKKLFAIVLVFTLGGCAELSAVSTGISLATKSVANPVTKTELAQVELAGDTIIQGMLVYKRACIKGAVDVNCKANIALVQAYTRQMPPLIAQLRSFVKNNDQVNATVIYNQLTQLYANAKAAAANLGINLGVN